MKRTFRLTYQLTPAALRSDDLVWSKMMREYLAKSGATRTLIPAQGGQHSGDCGQQVMAA